MATTPAYTLQILHQSDLEAGLLAVNREAQSAAIIDKLEDDYANTLKVISGDTWITGPFYSAEGDPSVQAALRAFYGNSTQAAAPARVSIAYMNAIGTNVATFGNHEFDAGTAAISDAIRPSSTNAGALFPYLSANYDFSNDPNLRTAVTADGQEASSIRGRIAGSTVVTIGGQRIGIVGATTQVLPNISSPGLVTGKTPAVDDMDALARVLQPYIDALIAQGINKIVLSTHLQQYQLEQQLIPKLSGVDIVISGGSHALFADGTDTVRSGDTVAQTYPVVLTNKDGNPVLQVNTENEYGYVGRLVVGFDAAGNVLTDNVDPTVSGNYVTTDAGVAALYGAADPYAAGSKGAAVRALIAPVGNVINVKDGNIQGYTNVFLNGNRLDVRNQETNLGDLSADANLFVARAVDPTVAVSIKNGGGIRDVIGSYTTDAASRPIPPAANPGAGKPAGAVSQLDVENSLRFNNNLSLVTVSAQSLYRLIEHGVAAYAPGTTPGQFPQVSGVQFSFDPTRTAQVEDTAGNVTTPGQRIRNLQLTNADGTVRDVIVQDGMLVGDPNRAIRTVTLDFQASGGDGYRFDVYGSNRVDLRGNPILPAGLSTFAEKGTEQDALGEFLKANAATANQGYAIADSGLAGDVRIQNLSGRADAVLSAGSVFPVLNLSGLRVEAVDLLNRGLGVPAGQRFVLSTSDGAGLTTPVAGYQTIAYASAPVSGSTVALAAGFRAGVLGGSAAAALVSSADGVVLVGNQGRSLLVGRGTGSLLVAGGGGNLLFGGAGASTFLGSDGDDTMVGTGTFFTGGGGNVVSLTGSGSVVVAEGRDTVIAAAGNDTIGARNSSVVAFGGAGRLTFVGGGAASTVSGGQGSVFATGGAGGGVFVGGAAGGNVLVGGDGAATLVGGGTGDLLFATGSGRTLLSAGSGNETLTGAGSSANNIFFAGSGNDVIGGGAGNDAIFAGTGSSTIDGGAGADLVVFVNGRSGGTVVVNGFRPGEGDRLTLQGYAAGEAGRALAAAGRSNTIVLSDRTSITFGGAASLDAASFV